MKLFDYFRQDILCLMNMCGLTDWFIGTYAVKKVAVGHSKSYLHHKLREVKLLEALRHPNIIAYHHAWIDMTRFSECVQLTLYESYPDHI